ncbi:hypothetical protein NA57DRAFT_71175 [Rhizodiscina lignyota]|uniref:Uncharacterized protein n=1 Tax=Rhizodiscina lignyota TaxID=1504668 RepID=A0A9P4MH13_9PEZI|nr:hypothetical protein NA57DRAFT_71175 [Rhizodiscina lignyota]
MEELIQLRMILTHDYTRKFSVQESINLENTLKNRECDKGSLSLMLKWIEDDINTILRQNGLEAHKLLGQSQPLAANWLNWALQTSLMSRELGRGGDLIVNPSLAQLKSKALQAAQQANMSDEELKRRIVREVIWRQELIIDHLLGNQVLEDLHKTRGFGLGFVSTVR